MNAIDLDGRTALVMGATGCLGRAGAMALAARGACVVVVDTDAPALAETFGADGRYRIRSMDARDPERFQALAEEFPHTDVLVHCPAGSTSPELLDIASCRGAIRSFAPAMVDRRRGSIIAFSPMRVPAAKRGKGIEWASRGAISQLVKGFASELAPHGVRVNTIAPSSGETRDALAFLASDRSSHMTGSVLVIDEGWTAVGSLFAAPF